MCLLHLERRTHLSVVDGRVLYRPPRGSDSFLFSHQSVFAVNMSPALIPCTLLWFFRLYSAHNAPSICATCTEVQSKEPAFDRARDGYILAKYCFYTVCCVFLRCRNPLSLPSILTETAPPLHRCKQCPILVPSSFYPQPHSMVALRKRLLR